MKRSNQGLYVGRVGGIPVYLAWSWFLLTLLIVVVYGGTISRMFPLAGMNAYLAALVFAVLLALSVLVHELGHGLTARAFGWAVGRIDLSLMGGHTSFAGGLATPGRSALVALAGPLCNVVIALLGWSLLNILDSAGLLAALVFLVTFANAVVGLFNLIPGIPLDGGHVIEGLVWKATGSRTAGTRTGAVIGALTALGLVVWGLRPTGSLTLSSLVIVLLVAGHLLTGAWQAWQQAGLRARMARLRLAEIARPVEWVDAETPVSAVRAPQDPRTVLGVADDDGVVLGVVEPRALGQAVRSGDLRARVREVVSVVPDRPRVPEGTDGEALTRLASELPGRAWFVGSEVLASRLLFEADLIRALRRGPHDS